ncbi:hypothetical protein C8J56DRAFT_911197 [Mycena floridula]|nr:hypothetical protein C8J56DRAFT_911197 [Mycena floridula]
MPATRNIYSARQSRRLSNQSPCHQPEFWPEYVPQMFDEVKPVPDLNGKDLVSFHDPPSPGLATAPAHSSRQGSDGKIRRPRNAFIFYRSVFYKRIKSGAASIDQNYLSKQAGISWKSLSEAERAPYHAMAEAEKNRYTVFYPNYKYSPGSNVRSKPYSTKPKKPRAQSPSSSRTRSTSVESDYHPTASSSRRRIARPSRAAVASMDAVRVAISDDGHVAEPETEIVQIKEEPVKKEEAPVITHHIVESSSPEHHFFHMADQTTVVTQLNTPLPSSYYHIDEQFAFKAGVDFDAQLTLSSLNSTVDLFDTLSLKKKKKSKGKKRETANTDVHSDWELESMFGSQGLDMEFTPSVEHTSFLEMDFGAQYRPVEYSSPTKVWW